MRSAVIVKLGGSAITDKSKECTPNLSVLGRAVEDLADYPGPLVVLHGGGSYAHPIVTRAGLDKGYRGRDQMRSISETEFFLDQLTRIVGVSLMRRGRDFVCFRPMSLMILNKGRITQALIHPIMKAMELGLTPVIHGDLVFDKTNGVSVVSADRIASFLAPRLQVGRVIFGCDVDGVFNENPKVSRTAVLIERVNKGDVKSLLGKWKEDKRSDATGGMLGKVRECIQLARGGRESCILNLTKAGILADALFRRPFRGTRFLPWN